MVNAVAKDHMVLTKIAKETEEKADKKITAAKSSIQSPDQKWKQGAG